MEPTFDEMELDAFNELKEDLIEKVDIPLDVLKNEERTESYLRDLIQKSLGKYKKTIPVESHDKFIYYLRRDFLGYGKIDLLMKDQNIEDVSCNGIGIPIYVWHREHESIPTNITYETKDELDAIITRLAYQAGRQISIAQPIIEGTLPNGYRIHLTLDEVSKRGNTFTIRKFNKSAYTIIDLIEKGTIDSKIAAYLWLLVENGRSFMVSGATASGKTTLLNSICTFIKPEMKVVTIEEVRELRLHQNWIPMVTRPSFQAGVQEISLFDLLKSALRQRPDYISVGEVRGEEAYTLFQSIATGHGGLCTIHAESVESALKRLATRPMNIPPMILPMMNVIIQIRRIKLGEGFARRATNVAEISGLTPSGEPRIETRFRWNATYDRFEYVSPSEGFIDTLNSLAELRQIPVQELHKEIERRDTVIMWMLDKGIKSYDNVAEVIRRYYLDPDDVYNTARLSI
jgi:flagellar protein FlaI